MEPSEEHRVAHELFAADVTRASEAAGLPFRNMTDLVNTNQRYPQLVPLLIDWLKNVEAKTHLQDHLSLSKFRGALARTLTTIDATGTEAVPLLMDQFELDPPMTKGSLFAVGNALAFLALPSDYDRMRALATERTHGSGRVRILEWLIEQGLEDGVNVVVQEIEDPSVRALGIKYLRRSKPVPPGLRPAVEKYLDDPDAEVRKQTKLTLKKLPQ